MYGSLWRDAYDYVNRTRGVMSSGSGSLSTRTLRRSRRKSSTTTASTAGHPDDATTTVSLDSSGGDGSPPVSAFRLFLIRFLRTIMFLSVMRPLNGISSLGEVWFSIFSGIAKRFDVEPSMLPGCSHMLSAALRTLSSWSGCHTCLTFLITIQWSSWQWFVPSKFGGKE